MLLVIYIKLAIVVSLLLIDQVRLKLKVEDARTRLLEVILMSLVCTLKTISELLYFFVDFEDVWACWLCLI